MGLELVLRLSDGSKKGYGHGEGDQEPDKVPVAGRFNDGSPENGIMRL